MLTDGEALSIRKRDRVKHSAMPVNVPEGVNRVLLFPPDFGLFLRLLSKHIRKDKTPPQLPKEGVDAEEEKLYIVRCLVSFTKTIWPFPGRKPDCQVLNFFTDQPHIRSCSDH